MVVRSSRLFILVLLIFACVAGRAVAAEPEILIGATVSLEGPFQAPSRMMQLAYRLWEKQINSTGGLLGRPVRLIFYDDRSQKELARKYYEKLILEDKVDLVFAPYGTTLTYAASEVTERHGFVLMACAASGEMIWQRGYRYVFGVYGIANRYFIGFLDLAARNGLQTVAILNADTLFTRDAAAGAVSWARRLGLDLKLQRTYRQSVDDFPGIVSKLEKLTPDAIILCAYPPDGYLFLSRLAASGYRPPALALSIAPGLPEFYDKAGPLAEGVFGPSQWEPDERIPFPGTRHFIREFKAYAGVKPSYHAGSAFAACQLLQEALTASGRIDQNKIRDYISSLDTVTVIGRFKVDPQGRQIGHNPVLTQWQSGRRQIVYPSKMQTAKPLFGTWGSK